jgi:hypothetical protein
VANITGIIRQKAENLFFSSVRFAFRFHQKQGSLLFIPHVMGLAGCSLWFFENNHFIVDDSILVSYFPYRVIFEIQSRINLATCASYISELCFLYGIYEVL